MYLSMRDTQSIFLWRRLSIWALLTSSLLVAIPLRAAALDPAILSKVQAATFEVVQAKPTTDPLSYEKPLPLDLIPYQERNDKYYSVGTAFAIGHNRYVTAGHVVLSAIGDNLWGQPALRDGQGHVYAIDKIEKFSMRKDFVVFSLVNDPAPTPLAIDPKPALNQVIYAVGNALGEGVVARDGLYTSDSPEEQDGSWKWLRFSAAASPGNSGGPLLDKDGNVIGVVLRKSPNENLNYALSINEVLNAPDNLAVVDIRAPYQLPMLDTVLSNILKVQFPLPLSFSDFSATLTKLEDDYIDSQKTELLAKESDKLFPNGSGSDLVLYTEAPISTFPKLILRTPSGQWQAAMRKGKKSSLPDNAFIVNGFAQGILFTHIGRPDTISASNYYSDPKVMMDQFLKMGYVTRYVGTDKVIITSCGEPTQNNDYTDKWGRRWREDVWPMPYANIVVITDSLPVPDGSITLVRVVPTAQKYQVSVEMRVITDFVAVAYDGTLAQWKEFLQDKPMLPDAFKNIAIDFDYDRNFSYTSQRIHFVFTPQLQKISPDSELTLNFGFLNDGGHVAWDVADVRVKPDANTEDRINIRRNVAPTDDLDDKYKAAWQKYAMSQHPYDGVAATNNDFAEIAAVIKPTAASPSKVLYSAFYGTEGDQPQAVMKSKLDLLVNGLHVSE